MILVATKDFELICRNIFSRFLSDDAVEVKTKNWQGLDVTERPEMVPWELWDVTVETDIDTSTYAWQGKVKPNLPWAEMHFQERVSGIPHNPPPSHEFWPHQQAGNTEFRKDELFSHTYPERFWPKKAGKWQHRGPVPGIRFDYGDLQDVVDLIDRDPYTRQAFLPVFFPEDTGAYHRERIPCTLGYLFRYRGTSLDIVYYIRSCDFRRHFRDDVYMAGRLAQWMAEQLWDRGFDLRLGKLVMHIGSLHVFAGDLPLMRQEQNNVLGTIW